MLRNYLADLELDDSAELDDVRQAYIRLARRFHPDLNPDDQFASESFRRIREAYDFLNSRTRLYQIKTALRGVVKSTLPTRWQAQDGFANLLVREARNATPEIHLDVSLTAKSLRDPVQTLRFQVQKICSSCKGAGGHSKSMRVTCKTCAGLGYRSIRRGAYSWKKTCDACLGQGAQVLNGCETCAGSGRLMEEAEIQVKTPSMSKVEEVVLYRSCGHPSYDGRTRGDVWVKWSLRK